MKTLTTRPRSPRGRSRWLLAGVAPLVLATACSTQAPVTSVGPTDAASAATGTTAPGPSTPGETSASSMSPTPSSSSPTTTATPSPTTTTKPAVGAVGGSRVNTALMKVFADRGMGHRVVIGTVSRNIPWPAGNPVSEEAFEIVGVYLSVKAGGRYSASVAPAMFALGTADPSLVEPTTEFGSTLGKPLGTVARDQTGTGWLFFKVDRGAKEPFTLYLRRPAYKVSTTGKTIPATRYGAWITK
ncbi:MAG: DUF4352 domain-containing protein [Terracoccus sp.]